MLREDSTEYKSRGPVIRGWASYVEGRVRVVSKFEGVLCYVYGEKAFFTTQDLDEQWGDDWRDIPYEHNAGRPYKHRQDSGKEPWKITEIMFEGDFDEPDSGYTNSQYSVEQINNKVIPWLRGSRFTKVEGVEIWAGTPMEDFIRTVLECGGEIYLPIGLVDLGKVG